MQVGIDEKLGNTIPLNLSFLNEYGQPVKLQDLFGKPTLLMFMYYRCPSMCPLLLNGMQKTIDELDLEAGKDYNIITISFDPTDDYQTSLIKKKNCFDGLKKRIPENSWHFLTGDSTAIAKITDAAGFRYIRQGDMFIHGSDIIAISPAGKIARYLYGTDFNPFDVKMALIEASEGKSVPTISKIVQLCFTYDPEGKRYTLNITRITGGGILILIIGFVAFLTIKNKKKKKALKSNTKEYNTSERIDENA